MVRTSYPPVVKVWTRAAMHCAFLGIAITLASTVIYSANIARRGKLHRSKLNDPDYMLAIQQLPTRDVEIHQRILDWQPGDSLYSSRLKNAFKRANDI